MRPLKQPPDVMVLHRGRDEENVRGKVIQYRHVNRIRSKYDVSISAAGGVDLKEARMDRRARRGYRNWVAGSRKTSNYQPV